MANQIFMRVNEVAEPKQLADIFVRRADNQKYTKKHIYLLKNCYLLAKTGCITIAGRIDRKFFHEKFYGTRSETERKEK